MYVKATTLKIWSAYIKPVNLNVIAHVQYQTNMEQIGSSFVRQGRMYSKEARYNWLNIFPTGLSPAG